MAASALIGPSVAWPQSQEAVSNLRSDETILFFPVEAALTDDGRFWRARIHAWVFEKEEGDWLRGRLLREIGKRTEPILSEADRKRMDERLRWFLTDNERGKRIVVRLGERSIALGPSEADGHAYGEMTIPVDEAKRLAVAGDGLTLRFSAVLAPGDPRRFEGTIHCVEPEGATIISDIDDTVKITEVADRAKMMVNVLARPYQAVPGMAERYRRWLKDDPRLRLRFVSNSPWPLYEPLAQFFKDAGFPPAAVTLQPFRLKDGGVLQALNDPAASKRPAIERIMDQHPKRKFIFVGDTGERDPEIYGEIARQRPDRTLKIWLRDVSGESRASDRIRQALRGVPADRWELFRDGEGLPARPTGSVKPDHP